MQALLCNCRETEKRNEAARSAVKDQTLEKERIVQGLKEEAAETLLG